MVRTKYYLILKLVKCCYYQMFVLYMTIYLQNTHS